MTPEHYERVTELFYAALEIASDERTAFLERVSDGDADLPRELESLLAAHGQGAYTEKPPEDIAAGLFLAEQDGATGETVRKTLAPHTRIDRYAIGSTNLHTGKRSPVGQQSAPHASGGCDATQRLAANQRHAPSQFGGPILIA